MRELEIPCYAFSARHASRHLSQFYEHRIGGSGLHAQQFTILAIVKYQGPLTVNELADALAMDRTTLARSLKPLERDGLLAIMSAEKDRRRRTISMTAQGLARLEEAYVLWRQAQADFESRFGIERAARLRDELRAAAKAVAA